MFLMAILARQELLHRGEIGSCSALFPPTKGTHRSPASSSHPFSDSPPLDPNSNPRALIPTMSAHELSKLSGLGRSYVANLLKDFAKAGLLVSVRGKQGGYRLAKPPETISLRETLAVIEGPLRFVGCAEEALEQTEHPIQQKPIQQKPIQQSCDLMNICPSVGPMQVIHNRIVHLLEDLSLAELAKSGIPKPQLAQAAQTEGTEGSVFPSNLDI